MNISQITVTRSSGAAVPRPTHVTVNSVPKVPKPTLDERDTQWVRLKDGLNDLDAKMYNHVGLYRIGWRGKVVFVGRGTAHLRGGLYTRLRALASPTNKVANRHYSARMIREHIDEITVDVLIVGSGWRAAEDTKVLKRQMVKRYQPAWNQNIAKRIAQQATTRPKS